MIAESIIAMYGPSDDVWRLWTGSPIKIKLASMKSELCVICKLTRGPEALEVCVALTQDAGRGLISKSKSSSSSVSAQLVLVWRSAGAAEKRCC